MRRRQNNRRYQLEGEETRRDPWGFGARHLAPYTAVDYDQQTGEQARGGLRLAFEGLLSRDLCLRAVAKNKRLFARVADPQLRSER